MGMHTPQGRARPTEKAFVIELSKTGTSTIKDMLTTLRNRVRPTRGTVGGVQAATPSH